MTLYEFYLSDLIGAILGFTFTIFVFSYVWGDNALFRWATHIFIGAAAGYALTITIANVILPHLVFPLLNGNANEKILAIVYLIPGALVLTKLSPRMAKLGNLSMAMLVGIGAAAAVGGAVVGTIAPQVTASVQSFSTPNKLNAAFILIGTLSTLIYFQFSTPPKSKQHSGQAQLIRWMSWLGQAFIAITFAALFAGVYFAALTAFIERFSFIWNFIRYLFLPTLLTF